MHQTTIVEENENMAPSERVQIDIQYGAKTPINPVQEEGRGFSPYREEEGDYEQMNGWEEDESVKKAIA